MKIAVNWMYYKNNIIIIDDTQVFGIRLVYFTNKQKYPFLLIDVDADEIFDDL